MKCIFSRLVLQNSKQLKLKFVFLLSTSSLRMRIISTLAFQFFRHGSQLLPIADEELYRWAWRQKEKKQNQTTTKNKEAKRGPASKQIRWFVASWKTSSNLPPSRYLLISFTSFSVARTIFAVSVLKHKYHQPIT